MESEYSCNEALAGRTLGNPAAGGSAGEATLRISEGLLARSLHKTGGDVKICLQPIFECLRLACMVYLAESYALHLCI